MNKIIKILSPFVVLISITLLFVFRTVPAGKLWNKYSVMYVPISVDDTLVLNSLEKSEINEVVALSNQFLPLNISENSLEYAMYKANIDNSENDYIKARSSYFFDKSNKYRLYYIPNNYDHKLNKAVSLLNNQHVNVGINSNPAFPFIYPILIFIISIIIGIFTRNKLIYSLLVFIPNIYVFCNPFFQTAISTALVIICLFFISNVWKRKGSLSYLKTFIFIPICFLIALICGFNCSLSTGFMFVIGMVGVVGLYISTYWIEDYFRNKKSFIPVNIRPAKMVSILAGNYKLLFIIIGFSTILMLSFFAFSTSGALNNISSKIALPSSSDYESNDLPQLEDYYKWVWDITTYPYKSLNNEISNENTVSFPIFSAENGLIEESVETFIYDNNFKNNILNNINNLQFNSIEKVMESEGENFKGNYSSSSYHIDLFGIIMIIVCYLILLFMYFYIIIKRKGCRK